MPTMQNESNSQAQTSYIRRRDDLEIYPQRLRSKRIWVVKDPVTLKYFQFRAEEFAVLSWLDGKASLQRIGELFEKQFAPKRMTIPRLRSFVASLHRNGLVIADVAGQGDHLMQRHLKSRSSEWMSHLMNPMAIRFPGMDPHSLLRVIYPRVQWMFSTGFAFLCAATVAWAGLLFVGNGASFQQRLPELNSLLTPQNLIWLAVAMAATKVVHELGHALTCRHYGAECHEMGVMLLVMTPCLYCNVSDAWKLPARQRIAITAAGICIEIVLASVCTILWWFTHPGLINTIAFNVMVVCSVGTLFLNGNPLLRYDGYYILSDLVAAPNLWDEANGLVRRFWSRCFLGIDPGRSITAGNRTLFLALFSIASIVYRSIVMASVLYLMYRTLAPLGLVVVVQLIAVAMLVRIVWRPLKAVWNAMTNPVLNRQFRPKRFGMATALTVGLLVGILWLPMPCTVKSPSTIQPLDARRIYVTVAGTLRSTSTAGQKVKKGDVIAELDNPTLGLEIERVRGQLRQQELRVRSLESLRGSNAEISSQIPAAAAILVDLRQTLAQLERDHQSLRLVAKANGTILSPPAMNHSEKDRKALGRWDGDLLQARNLGAMVEPSTLYCLVGDPNQFEAMLLVHQSEVEFVCEGQEVTLAVNVAGVHALNGTITEVSRTNVAELPPELAADQAVPQERGESGELQPVDTWYRAHVRLEPTDAPLLMGARGHARISVSPQPLAKRVYRFLIRTFKPVA